MTEPEIILNSLIDAIAVQDYDRFSQICKTNAAMIFEHFASWRSPPKNLQDQPEKLKQYANALGNIAKLFEHSGYPQLLAMIMPSKDDTLTKWENAFLETKQLAGVGDHHRCLAKIERLLVDLENAGLSAGTWLPHLRGGINGVKRECLFALKRYGDARAAETAALEDYQRIGDEEGVRICRHNLAQLEAYDPQQPEFVDTEIAVLEAFATARRLADLRRFRASNDVLSGLLAMTGNAADIVETIRPYILGRLGFNQCKLENWNEARESIELARDLCCERQERDGAEVYAENLVALDSARTSAREGIS